jgi:hypothetical protein
MQTCMPVQISKGTAQRYWNANGKLLQDCAAASDKQGDKVGKGCADQEILHRTPDGHTHLMQTCMPDAITKDTAQRYWDAYDRLAVCLADKSKTSADCNQIATANIEPQLTLLGVVPPPEFKDALYVPSLVLTPKNALYVPCSRACTQERTVCPLLSC